MDHLERERIFVAADAAKLAAVSHRDDETGRRDRAAAPASARASAAGNRRRALVRIQDLLPERRARQSAHRGQIGTNHAAAAVHLMAAPAAGLSETQPFAW